MNIDDIKDMVKSEMKRTNNHIAEFKQRDDFSWIIDVDDREKERLLYYHLIARENALLWVLKEIELYEKQEAKIKCQPKQ